MEPFAVSVQFGFTCIAIYSSPHLTPSVCVPVYHPYGIVVRLWELGHVPPGNIYISCYQILERLLNSSIFVSSRCWAIVFVYAFQGIQPQHVCLLEELCRVFSYGICGFQSHVLWACRPLRYYSGIGSRISLISFLSEVVGGSFV